MIRSGTQLFILILILTCAEIILPQRQLSLQNDYPVTENMTFKEIQRAMEDYWESKSLKNGGIADEDGGNA